MAAETSLQEAVDRFVHALETHKPEKMSSGLPSIRHALEVQLQRFDGALIHAAEPLGELAAAAVTLGLRVTQPRLSNADAFEVLKGSIDKAALTAAISGASEGDVVRRLLEEGLKTYDADVKAASSRDEAETNGRIFLQLVTLLAATLRHLGEPESIQATLYRAWVSALRSKRFVELLLNNHDMLFETIELRPLSS